MSWFIGVIATVEECDHRFDDLLFLVGEVDRAGQGLLPWVSRHFGEVGIQLLQTLKPAVQEALNTFDCEHKTTL